MITADIARLTAPRTLRWERETIEPETLGSRDVIARTVVSAISPGTEVAAFVGAPPLRPGRIYPRLVGYCNLARVLHAGDGVTRCRPGDLILTHQSHRSAFVCPEDGILAVVDPAHDPVAASVAYLFHLGYAALLRAEFRPGMNVGVVGLGTIGLGTLALVADGGGNAIGFSDQADISAQAADFGARAVLPKSPDAPPADLPGGVGLDIVVTTSNTWADWRLALSAARRGGTIAMLGFPGRGQPAPEFNPLAAEFVYDKQLTILGCGMVPEADATPDIARFTLRRNMAWLVDRIGRGALPARRLVSETAPARELETLYRRLADRVPGLTTAVLTW